MHETAICSSIIKEAEKHGKVESIVLEVGELAHLLPDEVLYYMKQMTSWGVKVNEKKSSAKCQCGFTGRPKILERGHDFFLTECPKCGKTPQITKGDQIKIIEVKVK